MTDKELERVGREWLRVVDLVRRDGILDEHNHVRFRDSDLSVKGAAILGFAGLMLAADLVFLSAANDSFIAPDRTCGTIGIAALYVLVAGAFCAVISIMISRRGTCETGWASFGLMKLFHDRRQWWLSVGSLLTCAGTLMYLLAMTGVVAAGRCYP
jgi:hypothetical protein